MTMQKRIWAQLGAVAVITVLGIGLTAAWFINYRTNLMKAPQIRIEGGEFMEISHGSNPWSNAVEIQTKTLHWDVTGDGVTLLRPVLTQSGVTASPDQSAEWQPASGEPEGEWVDYIEIPLTFRSDKQVSIYLDKNSKVTPHGDPEKLRVYTPQGVTGEDRQRVVNVSSHSTNTTLFSRNYIAGAVRVAVLEEETDAEGNTQLTRKALWIPNRDIQLVTDPYDVKTGADAAVEDSYTYFDSTKTQRALAESEYCTLDEDAFVTQMPAEKVNGMYQTKLVVRVWVEGTDREARLALAGGEFDVYLRFTSSDESAQENNS